MTTKCDNCVGFRALQCETIVETTVHLAKARSAIGSELAEMAYQLGMEEYDREADLLVDETAEVITKRRELAGMKLGNIGCTLSNEDKLTKLNI